MKVSRIYSEDERFSTRSDDIKVGIVKDELLGVECLEITVPKDEKVVHIPRNLVKRIDYVLEPQPTKQELPKVDKKPDAKK